MITVQSPGHEEFASDALPSVNTEINRDTVQVVSEWLGLAGESGH